MANGRAHRKFGATCGALAAFHRSRSLGGRERCLEVVGGTLAGAVFGALPDIVEPACHPNHRAVAHGIVPGVVVTKVGLEKVDGCQASLREFADQHARLARESQAVLGHLFHTVVEVFLRLLSGAMVGAVAGHVSHLVLDAGTPKGLPLLG